MTRRLRQALLDLRIWWLEVRIEACTDPAMRERLGAEFCRLVRRKWGGCQ